MCRLISMANWSIHLHDSSSTSVFSSPRQMRSGARVSQLYEGGGSNRSDSSGSSRESPRSPRSPTSKSPVYNVPRPTSPLASSQSQAAAWRGGHSSTRSPDKLLPVSQITYGDATFMGSQRYAPNAASLQRPKQQVESQFHDLNIDPHESQWERPRVSRQDTEDDQYVPIFSRPGRASFLEDRPDGRQQQQQQGFGVEGPADDGYDYLKMTPAPSRLHTTHGYLNLPPTNGSVGQPRKGSLDCIGEFREEVPAYAVSSVRDHVRSSLSNTSDSPRSTPSFGQSPSPIHDRGSNPLEDTTGVDASLLAEPLVPTLSPPPKGEGNPYVLEPTSLPQPGTNASFVSQPRRSQSTSTSPFLPRGGDAYDQSSSSHVSSPESRPYNYGGGERRIGFASQKSLSFDAQPTTTTPMAVVNRSSSFQSRPGGSPRQGQRSHGYDKIPTPQMESRPLTGMDLTASSPAASQGLEAILLAEFPDISQEMCKQALECARFNLQRAREEVQIQLLLQMGVTFMTADDCRRALSHCQWKLDRAASWLLEQSTDITTRIS